MPCWLRIDIFSLRLCWKWLKDPIVKNSSASLNPAGLEKSLTRNMWSPKLDTLCIMQKLSKFYSTFRQKPVFIITCMKNSNHNRITSSIDLFTIFSWRSFRAGEPSAIGEIPNIHSRWRAKIENDDLWIRLVISPIWRTLRCSVSIYHTYYNLIIYAIKWDWT